MLAAIAAGPGLGAISLSTVSVPTVSISLPTVSVPTISVSVPTVTVPTLPPPPPLPPATVTVPTLFPPPPPPPPAPGTPPLPVSSPTGSSPTGGASPIGAAGATGASAPAQAFGGASASAGPTTHAAGRSGAAGSSRSPYYRATVFVPHRGHAATASAAPSAASGELAAGTSGRLLVPKRESGVLGAYASKVLPESGGTQIVLVLVLGAAILLLALGSVPRELVPHPAAAAFLARQRVLIASGGLALLLVFLISYFLS